MKRLFSIFAMAAVVLASCVKEQTPVLDGDQNDVIPSENLVEKVFTVGDPESKTYIDGTVENNKVVIKWCADDAISVWDGVANRKFTMVGEPDGASATFKGLVSESATEFYAIYPYDENLQYSYNEAQSWMQFTVIKPAVQYANPEGGLADNSAYACGKADADGHIRFENRSALLKFSLASGMNVRSVTIKGNEDDDILAGTLNFRYNESNNFSLGWGSAGKSTEVTFCNKDDSNLKTGVDYFISLTGNNFAKGFAVTLTLDDGKTLTRNSEKSVQYMSNQIYSLASKPLSRTTFGATYYEAYEAGEDIVIAGKVYNKTTHPNATLLTETATISANGLYFLDPAEGQTITLGTNNLTKIAIVGNNPTKRVELAHQGFRLNAAAEVAVMNLSLPATAGVQTIQEAVAGAAYVVFENCKIKHPNGTCLVYNQAAGSTMIADFVMTGCDYEISPEAAANANGVFLFNGYMDNSDITLENNVFYVTDSTEPVKKFKITVRADTKPNSLVMKNNTFINTLANEGDSGFCKNGVVFKTIDLQNNLFHVDLMAKNHFIFMNGMAFESGQTLNNAYYKADLTYTFRMFNGSQNTPSFASTDLTKLTASPFSSMDHANGVFVKTETAAAYGAKR